MKQENNDLKNQITNLTKNITQTQSAVKGFNELKKRVDEAESQIQQNEEDNISLEIRVNKLEKVQEIWNKAAAKYETTKIRKSSSNYI